MPAATGSVQLRQIMTAMFQSHLRLAGALHMGCQQRCDVTRPVVISVWNKYTGTGIQT